MQRGRERERKGIVSVLRRNEGGRSSLGRETSPLGSAGTGGRRVQGEAAQKGVQRMSAVELAFRRFPKVGTPSAAPGGAEHSVGGQDPTLPLVPVPHGEMRAPTAHPLQADAFTPQRTSLSPPVSHPKRRNPWDSPFRVFEQ